MAEILPPVCFYCTYFDIEPGALDSRLTVLGSTANRLHEIPMIYGKCAATNPKIGKLAPTPCDVAGGDGNLMFEHAPED